MKTRRQWIQLDYSHPDSLRAEDIPYDATSSIYDAINAAVTGQSGYSGSPGASGYSGYSGAVGGIGLSGYSGASGNSGYSGAAGASIANIIPLGLPTDGTFAGILPFDASTFVTDAIDGVNDLLLAISPSPPGDLTSALTLTGTIKYSAILPTGLSAAWYQDGKVAGDTIADYMIDPTYRLASPSQSSAFRVGSTFGGDVGTVSHLLDGAADSTRAIADGTGTTGTLSVTSVSTFNAIWRIANAQIDYTQATEGYRYHAMQYQYLTTIRTTPDVKFWYDGSNPTPVVSTPVVTQNVLSSARYLSGIRYYTIGDTFDISGTVQNIANRGIKTTAPVYYSMTGLATVNKSITSMDYDGTYTIADVGVALNFSNVSSANARLSVGAVKPSGASGSGLSASQNRLINTFSPSYSTNGDITMYDEYFRYPGTYDFSSVPPVIWGQWDSTAALANGNGQLYNGSWTYPTINFTSGYLPAQGGGTNYSAFSGDQSIVWVQNIGLYHNKMTINFTGLSNVLTQISQDGTGSLNVGIRLPSVTGWLDAGRDFDFGLTNGCRNSGGSSGSLLALTFGSATSSDSTGIVVIRAVLRNASAAQVSRMVITGT